MEKYFNEAVTVLIATLACNKDCPFCLRNRLNEKYNLPLDNMDVETAKKILEQYPDGKYITVTGGEPFLNMPLLRYLYSTGLYVKVVTNGTILLPDDIQLNDKMYFEISMHDREKPPLYQQLLEKKFSGIKVYIYLDKDLKKVSDIIDMLALDNIKGYEVLPEEWEPLNSEYENFIKEAAKMLANKLRYNKDIGYSSYLEQVENLPVRKFAPDGTITDTLFGVYLPEKDRFELDKITFKDYNIFSRGRKLFKYGKSIFKSPCEYYSCLMYETMKEIWES